MSSYMMSSGSCLMVTRTIFQCHLLEVGLIQDHGILNAHNRWFIFFYYVWRPSWINYSLISHLVEGTGTSTCLHTTFEGRWPHYMILEVSWDGLWTLSSRLSEIHGHGSCSCVKWPLCDFVGVRENETKNNALLQNFRCKTLDAIFYVLVYAQLAHVHIY